MGLFTALNAEAGLPTKLENFLQAKPLTGDTDVADSVTYATSKSGKWVAVGYMDGSIRFFSTRTGEQVHDPEIPVLKIESRPAALKQSSQPITFLAFMENDAIIVATELWTNCGITISYYFDIRKFFDPKRVKARIVVGRVENVSPEELVKKLVVNYGLDRDDKSTIWPGSPVN